MNGARNVNGKKLSFNVTTRAYPPFTTWKFARFYKPTSQVIFQRCVQRGVLNTPLEMLLGKWFRVFSQIMTGTITTDQWKCPILVPFRQPQCWKGSQYGPNGLLAVLWWRVPPRAKSYKTAPPRGEAPKRKKRPQKGQRSPYVGKGGGNGGAIPPRTSKKVLPTRQNFFIYCFSPPGRLRRPKILLFEEKYKKKRGFWGKNLKKWPPKAAKRKIPPLVPPPLKVKPFYPPGGPGGAQKPLPPQLKFPRSPPRWPTPRPPMEVTGGHWAS